MTSVSGSASKQTAHPQSKHLTLGWLAKRSALWLLIMALGIGAACGLYALAEEPQSLQTAKPTPEVSAPKG
jgi:hypothetical protein